MNATHVKDGMMVHERALKAYAITLTKDQHQAGDLLQETLYRAFKYRDKFKVGTNLKGWLYTIMRNIFINNYRSKKRRKVIFDSSDNLYLLDHTAGGQSNDSEGSVLKKEIEHLVEDLREDYRVPFVMAYKGHKYDDIASHLGLPLGTIKSRIFLARKTLQQQVKSLYGVSHFTELVSV